MIIIIGIALVMPVPVSELCVYNSDPNGDDLDELGPCDKLVWFYLPLKLISEVLK